MTIKPKKGSWHLFNNCGKIIVNLLFVFSTRGAQLFSSYSLLINESFNYSPKVISFLSSSEEFSLAILVSTFLPLPIVFSFVGRASQTLILDIASKQVHYFPENKSNLRVLFKSLQMLISVFQSNTNQYQYIYIYIYKRRDLMLESMRLCNVAHFLKVLFIQFFTSTKFAFILKYQFIELVNQANAYINYLLLCINYSY